MNYTQKCALFGLYLAGLMMLVPVIDLVDKYLPFYLMQILVFVGVFLLMFPLYRMNKIKNKTFDEHDKKICLRAGLIAIAILCAAGIVFYMTLLFAFESFSLNSDHLAIILYWGAILFIASLSLATLFQYCRLHKTERNQS